jgi:hypothetical protein
VRPTFAPRRHLRRLAERQGVVVPIVHTRSEASQAIDRLQQRRRQGQLPGFREASA